MISTNSHSSNAKDLQKKGFPKASQTVHTETRTIRNYNLNFKNKKKNYYWTGSTIG